MEHPCKDCVFRCVGCHGRTAEGGYRCTHWERYSVEMQRANRVKKAESLTDAYIGEAIGRHLEKKFKGR